MAKTHEKNTLFTRRSLKFAEEVMVNLTGCQACSHSLNTKCCDPAYGFEKPMQAVMNTHTHLIQINMGKLLAFVLSKDVFFLNNLFFRQISHVVKTAENVTYDIIIFFFSH